MSYRTIVADPPWWEAGGGKIKRGADRWYPLVKDEDIPAAIASSPLWDPDLEGCHVWLWTPSWRCASGQAADVLRALGARPVRKLTWVKPGMGIGQYARGAHEDLVLGVIGKLRPLPTARSVRDVLECDGPLGENGKRIHSAKPHEMYEERVKLISPGPRAALFERLPRVGFDTWGDLRGKREALVARWLEAKQKHLIEVRRAA